MIDFDGWAAKELPDLNAALKQKNMEPVQPLTREEWEKKSVKK
jgi:hypothetical protein